MLSCVNMLYCNFAVQVSTISQCMYFKVVTKLYLLQWHNFKCWAPAENTIWARASIVVETGDPILWLIFTTSLRELARFNDLTPQMSGWKSTNGVQGRSTVVKA